MPEALEIDLKNLDNLPEIIRDNIRNEDKLPKLMMFLKLPKFAELMHSESNHDSKTYSANSTPNKQLKKHPGLKILDILKTNPEPSFVESKNENNLKT